MNELPVVSIITPTYNRADSLSRSLAALAHQTYPVARYEVVVVDDGSSDHTEQVCTACTAIAVRYVLQDHAGGTQAKNTGAVAARGALLIFLDDDITTEPQFIESLVKEQLAHAPLIVMGSLYQMTANKSLLRASPQQSPPEGAHDVTDEASLTVPFTQCLGGCFSIWRSDFLELGKLQDPAPGFWPNWEDVDLGYRAHLRGFQFRRSRQAIAYHWDHSYDSLDVICRRSWLAGRSAVHLFQRHPGLRDQLPMFREKEPLTWGKDSVKLLLNKGVRRMLWMSPSVFVMRKLAQILEKHQPNTYILVLLYRWIISAHIYKGYQEGHRELAEAKG